MSYDDNKPALGRWSPAEIPEDETWEELQQLATEWQANRGASSFSSRAVMHPAYQSIIGKGLRAVPFLLRQLQAAPDHWFVALMSITGEDPVPPEDAGDVAAMARAWIEWGKVRGFVSIVSPEATWPRRGGARREAQEETQ